MGESGLLQNIFEKGRISEDTRIRHNLAVVSEAKIPFFSKAA